MLTVNIPVLRVGIPGGRHAPGHAAVPAFAGQPHSLGHDPGEKLVVLIGQRNALAMAVKSNRRETGFPGCSKD